MPVEPDGAGVLLKEHAAPGGFLVAEVALNAPASLNALSLAMAEAIAPALRAWRDDQRVACVLFTGAGDRAFCAGGDIRALYRAMRENRSAGRIADDYPFRFFEQEYRLDHLIHSYPKPVAAVGQGIVMGGGLGIFSGARFRVVTETSRIAYPEVGIGLFPDAGGTWMLRNMPPPLAAFLGCTGSPMNGADALAAGIATHSVPAAGRGEVLAGLRRIQYAGQASDAARIAELLAALPAAALPESQADLLPDRLNLAGGYAEVAARIAAWAGASPWVDRGIAAMRRGCPTTVGIVVEQLRRAPKLSLADCFRLEMTVAARCAMHEDFPEGVRALLIEKDNRPRWRFASLEDLEPEHVLEHFQPPWPQNPLHDLEVNAQ